MYQIRFYPKAKKGLKKITGKYRQRIIIAIENLRKNPYSGKKLEGELGSQRCIRIWPYRVIYCISAKKLLIIIIYIAHRQGVYK